MCQKRNTQIRYTSALHMWGGGGGPYGLCVVVSCARSCYVHVVRAGAGVVDHLVIVRKHLIAAHSTVCPRVVASRACEIPVRACEGCCAARRRRTTTAATTTTRKTCSSMVRSICALNARNAACGQRQRSLCAGITSTRRTLLEHVFRGTRSTRGGGRVTQICKR